jgi:predicted metal-dependent phosphoesterase TrpH
MPVLGKLSRECYTDPAELYETLKRRGLDLVTVTDHDSIEAAESLGQHADFFASEEVTARMPSGTEAHIGVYDISERQHEEIQRRRSDFIGLIMYLTERRIFFVLNHPLSALTGRREAEDFEWFEAYIPVFEAINGHMPASTNAATQRLAKQMRKQAAGGSDAHTLASAGAAWTEVASARTKEEFLAGLRAGAGVPRGRQSGALRRYWNLTLDVFLITGEMMREKPWTAALAPLAGLIPAVTLGQSVAEFAFEKKWRRVLERESAPRAVLWANRPPAEEFAWR